MVHGRDMSCGTQSAQRPQRNSFCGLCGPCVDRGVGACAVQCSSTVANPAATTETFTPEETRALMPYFTNTDRPVFALTNLPETVKGALFARYSRSAKSVRRLFLDEFLGQIGAAGVRGDYGEL